MKNEIKNFFIINFSRNNKKGKAYIFDTNFCGAFHEPIFSKDTPDSLKNDPLVQEAFRNRNILSVLIETNSHGLLDSFIFKDGDYINRHPRCIKVLKHHHDEHQKFVKEYLANQRGYD